MKNTLQKGRKTLTALGLVACLLMTSIVSSFANNNAVWVSEIGAQEALIGYAATSEFDHSVIEFGPVGFTLGTGTITSTNMNPFTLEGLHENSFYHCYIKEYSTAGNLNKQVGPILFQTGSRSFTYDASIDAVERYTKVPINQASFYPKAVVRNTGTNA
ncbi:MAG: hypothetical protein HKN22_04830, partial [Bacteroidia bacterium]|nr:hypothetical protein [Bacteroidia bacterium]